jgi:hypothetical protein
MYHWGKGNQGRKEFIQLVNEMDNLNGIPPELAKSFKVQYI